MSEYTLVTESGGDSRSSKSVLRKRYFHSSEGPLREINLFFDPRIWCGQLPIYILLSISIFLLAANIIFSITQYGNTCKPSEYGINTASEYDTTDKNCIQRLSSYTPALNSIHYSEVNLYDAYSNGDKYVGPPTQEREQNWRELWQQDLLDDMMNADEATMVENWAMPMLNRTDLEQYERIEADGKEGFTAMSKVYHQLGCLDIIRQYTWLLAGRYPPELVSLEMQKPAEETRTHIDLCIEDIRISLMCYSDMTPILITKERDPDSGFKAELNSHHKCRNFRELQDWTIAHGVEHWETEGGFHQHGDRF